MVNKEELMQKLLSKFDNVFREEINSYEKDNKTIRFTMIQSEHNNTIYSFCGVMVGLESSYTIFKGEEILFVSCCCGDIAIGDYEFGKEFQEKLLEQYDKQRKEKMPFFVADKLTSTMEMLEE